MDVEAEGLSAVFNMAWGVETCEFDRVQCALVGMCRVWLLSGTEGFDVMMCQVRRLLLCALQWVSLSQAWICFCKDIGTCE
jgi:hypothetical protein